MQMYVNRPLKSKMIALIIGVIILIFLLIFGHVTKEGKNEPQAFKENPHQEIWLKNCLIVKNSEEKMKVFYDQAYTEFPIEGLSGDFHNEIADVYLKNGKVTKILIKKDRIQGKILSVKENAMEVEGYGLIPMEEGFRFYDMSGDYKEKSGAELIVGSDQVQYAVAEGKICAAILDKPISVEKIRVLIKTTGYENLLHNQISLRAQGEYELICGSEKKDLHEGEELNIGPEDEGLKEGRIRLVPKSENARLAVLSIERNYGTPVYAGTMEIAKETEGLSLVNELDLETYLYSVVPSEMPASYEMEALKAQAVCARSYAHRQIMENGHAAYGAHVDDSVSFQVYNNLTTNEKVIKAVNETAGEVLKFGDEIAITYYYSTSCGSTTNETIWEKGSVDNAYLSGKVLNGDKEKPDLKKEEVFRDFILNEPYETYDSEENWYRWELTVPVEKIAENVSSLSDIGKVKNVTVTERNEGGVAQKILIEGDRGKFEVVYEYAIRSVLNGEGQNIKRKYGKDAVAGALLPSGFFIIDPVKENEKLTGFRIRGGGFGHGAGMSQNGANHMAEEGKSYQEILNLFYEGTTLTDYEDE